MSNTRELSKNILKDMAIHYKNDVATIYPMPLSVTFLIPNSDLTQVNRRRVLDQLKNPNDKLWILERIKLKNDLNNIKAEAVHRFTNINYQLKEAISQILEQFKNDKNKEKAKQDIKKKEEVAKQQVSEAFDRMTEDAFNLIEQVPDSSNDVNKNINLIVETMNKVFISISSATNSIGQIIKNILSEIIGIISEVVQWVKDTVNKIGNAIGDAVVSIIGAIGL